MQVRAGGGQVEQADTPAGVLTLTELNREAGHSDQMRVVALGEAEDLSLNKANGIQKRNGAVQGLVDWPGDPDGLGG